MFQSTIFPILIITGAGLVCAVILSVAAKFMAVKKDERFEALRAALPGVNCGACGYNGCDEYARALAADPSVPTNLCVPGADAASRELSGILGVEFQDVVEQSAVVKCSGDCDATSYIMDYRGVQTCEACNIFYQGRGMCSHACLGFGDCVAVCQYDAIHVVNGIAVVDKSKCTGCGMCAKKCPNHLIEVRDATKLVFVGCSSTDKGAHTRKICKAGCIGCRRCEKACPTGAITVNDNLAHIDPAKCTNCRVCVEQCPTKVIKSYLK